MTTLLASELFLILLTSPFHVEAFNVTPIPHGFSIGASSSAYQIEGAWNVDGKGESSWDHKTHNEPWLSSCGVNADVTCNSYYQYKEDVHFLKTMGLNHYRFSLSWTRILPNGYAHVVNQKGIAYYRNLLSELRANGIEPYVTIYHWDHPEVFNKYGGWTNELMIEWFADYARVVFRELGYYVKFFTTINDPATLCKSLYGSTNQTSGGLDEAVYICGHNILKAHARAYFIYNSEFRPRQRGQVGIALLCNNHYAGITGDNVSEDVAFDCDCGWFGNPIFSTQGDYPHAMKQRIWQNSAAEGRSKSRLPEFSSHWINYIRGSSDYFGLNHYTSDCVISMSRNQHTPFYKDTGLQSRINPSWHRAANNWLYAVPDGFGKILRKIKAKYNNPAVYVLENGWSDYGTFDFDAHRVDYLYSYMCEMFKAIKDGCNVKAYTVRSLLDSFEWEAGYTERFGLVYVNFTDPLRTRTPKYSAYWLRQTACSRVLLPIQG